MKPGDKVWYEPSDGLRFAGVILGDGNIKDCMKVHLCGHYWQWKGDKSYRNRTSGAISKDSLFKRETTYVVFDTDASFELGAERYRNE